MAKKNPLIAFYIRSCIAGFALAAVFTGAILWFDIGRIAHLVVAVDGGWLALFLLWFFNGIVFSGAQAAVSVLLMAEKDEPDDDQRGKRPDLIAVPVVARARR